jgi:hypothetical protein
VVDQKIITEKNGGQRRRRIVTRGCWPKKDWFFITILSLVDQPWKNGPKIFIAKKIPNYT